jgi:LmbE family N-acetylglucosaminyl deacetylase
MARLLGVFAHPDDEVFCCGGTMARHVAEGAEAMVASATRGEAGQVRDATVATRRTLGEVRERELREGCARLGVQHVRVLDHRDGTLGDDDPGALATEVAGIIAEFEPDVVITFGADGAYGHPDHMAISAATTRAFALAGSPGRLYHSHFPRSRLFMFDRLAQWLLQFDFRFRGGPDFIRAFSLFAQESTTMRYAGDHVAVQWFPGGVYVIEQGEPATSLYLILSGEVEVVHEQPDGALQHLRTMAAGQFFGEVGLAGHEGRTAHVVAKDNVTCLVLSPGPPTAFAPRGADGQLPRVQGDDPGWPPAGATTRIDVSAYVDRKMAAIAAHRSQYPVEPAMFPHEMLREMLGQEFFVRMHPPVELEDGLLPP